MVVLPGAEKGFCLRREAAPAVERVGGMASVRFLRFFWGGSIWQVACPVSQMSQMSLSSLLSKSTLTETIDSNESFESFENFKSFYYFK